MPVNSGCGMSPARIVQRFERIAETFSLATTRTHFTHRVVFPTGDRDELGQQLDGADQQREA